ncbi:FAD-binding domain-containing protein [Cylindrobasidium torrendii FP15055 ss-10]|uniref:D-lactate dehydrogenase (cytochrome) n=1 Tax=Cylindrobasidium torrendii FP15055 ss-10 TaxID=1314674 RepID=A0A0D7BTX2_9AGAR|nr:FAD-binding domain-containing protein [Cylindrobasidium torrendii FP15055 ss-10]
MFKTRTHAFLNLNATRHFARSTLAQAGRIPTRLLSTTSGVNKLKKNYLPYGLVALSSGLIGYLLAPQSGSVSTKDEFEKFGSAQDYEDAIAELRSTFRQREGLVTTDPSDLAIHGYSTHDNHHPEIPFSVVTYPESTDDVVEIVKISNKYRVPIVPYSGATSLEGHTRGHPTGGICIDVSGMNKILQVNAADSDLVCQPGVGWMDLNAELQERGIQLFFPLDPAPSATIGGMLSTGCSGTNAVRYGTAKGEWFLNATVVLPSGEVIKTRRRSRKSSAGFDVTKLFIGAEGTLGIVTEVTIRLAPLLPTNVATVQFPNVRLASEAVIDILNTGVGIQCIELVDDVFMKATNVFGQSSRVWPEKDGLFIKIQGPSKASLEETAKIVRQVAEKHGGTNFTLAKSKQEADDLWTDRKNAHYSGLALRPGFKGWPTDVCVPISKLPQLVEETKADLASVGLVSPIVGHAGDGNFHAHVLYQTEEEASLARAAVKRMNARAVRLDGTCTGEHGVGLGKKEYLTEELGEGTVALMKLIKRTIDPYGLFNPGKLYPDSEQGKDRQ